MMSENVRPKHVYVMSETVGLYAFEMMSETVRPRHFYVMLETVGPEACLLRDG